MDFKPKTYRISSVWSILLEISHFSFLCQLKVLGHFAKKWFGKKKSGGSQQQKCNATKSIFKLLH